MKFYPICWLFFLWVIFPDVILGQSLESLPRMQRHPDFKTEDQGTQLLLNTIANIYDSVAQNRYVPSVQIIDAHEPWPPRWYHCNPLISDKQLQIEQKEGVDRLMLILDAKVEGGFLSFFKLETRLKKEGYKDHILDLVQGYLLLDTNYLPLDTVISPTPHELYWHDFRINPSGERLISIKNMRALNLSKITEHAEDTAVWCDIDIIQVLNSDNRLIYSWTPTDHLDPSIFQLEESIRTRPFAKKKKNPEIINWSHLTGTIWDYDDNILYAFRFVGIGKVSRQDQSVVWQINYSDLPLVIQGDSLEWFFPHDLNRLKDDDQSVVYSLFSLGSASFPKARGVVFKMDKNTHEISSFRYYDPYKNFRTDGQGSFELASDGRYLFSYGIYENPEIVQGYFDEIEYGRNDTVEGVIQISEGNMCYKVRRMEDWPVPERPKISQRGDVLVAEGGNELFEWYEIGWEPHPTVTFISTGAEIDFDPRKRYCVAVPYGIGYAVSSVFMPVNENPELPWIALALAGLIGISLVLLWRYRRTA